MKRHRMPDIKENRVNVTPLIDIVMCLIIFFMLVAKIGVSTGAEPMEIPETVLGVKLEDLGNTLTLNVRRGAGEEPRVTALIEGKPGQEIPLWGLDAAGNSPLVNVLSQLRKNNDKFSVVIRAPKDLPYHLLEPVLLATAQANIRNVSFNTRIVTKAFP